MKTTPSNDPVRSYVIAASATAHTLNLGVTIMASGLDEAVQRYMAIEGVCKDTSDGQGIGEVYVVCESGETWTVPVEYGVETVILEEDEEAEEEKDSFCVNCPKCGHRFDPDMV